MNHSEVRVFIVDDHPVVHDGLKLIFEHEDDIAICGTAFDANSAIVSIGDVNPDVAIIDISLKGSVSGIELIKAIISRYPHVKILVLSMFDESVYAERAIRAGARGYIMKQVMSREIIAAVKRVIEGKIYLSEEMTSRLLDEMMHNHGQLIKDSVEALTNREMEIFQLIGQGMGTKEISEKLSLSIKTIDTYKLRLKNKLNLADSRELTKYAIEWLHEKTV